MRLGLGVCWDLLSYDLSLSPCVQGVTRVAIWSRSELACIVSSVVLRFAEDELDTKSRAVSESDRTKKLLPELISYPPACESVLMYHCHNAPEFTTRAFSLLKPCSVVIQVFAVLTSASFRIGRKLFERRSQIFSMSRIRLQTQACCDAK